MKEIRVTDEDYERLQEINEDVAFAITELLDERNADDRL